MQTDTSSPRRHPDDVRDAIDRCGITKAALCERTGLNKNTLTGLHNPEWDPRWSTLDKLCRAADEIKAERR